MGFKTEKDLFDTVLTSIYFQRLINSKEYITYLVEPRGLFGIPDLVVVNTSRTLAFEMKLSNWKRALIQAFRYRAFVDKSFVVIDKKHLSPALSNIEQFKKANIGLISIDLSGKIEFHYKPKSEVPYSENLVSVFKKMIAPESLPC